jgi:hypothetical protein
MFRKFPLKHIFYLFIFLFFLNITSEAQVTTLSYAAEISIITIGPGENLYDKFGHSAFRIKDNANGIDWAYNYGTYDFNTPNFYTKFAQGKLNYNLSVAYFEAFYQNYVQENRWVKEQVLNLSNTEKNALFQYLQNNAKPENRGYLYDFFFDNCATRIRDVLKTVLGDDLEYNDRFVTEQYTFRELIQKNVKANTWGSLGMDVAIGAVVDRPATAWEYQFLPQYVFEAAAVATVTKNNVKEPLVKLTNSLFENTPKKDDSNFFMSPVFVFGILGFIILVVTYQDFRKRKRSRYLDGVIFFVTGLIGIILLLLWLGTDHSTTVNNYNLLWAFPVTLFLFTLISKKQPKKWLSKYYAFLLVLFALLCLHSITGVQTFAIGFIPLFIALGIRYIYVFYFLKKQTVSVNSK